ncbi:MAG: tyrosine-type recombinase/integrase [Pyrinomonadaceae bacterium]|nr:tyrosine-type recombinase/integrase [Pyrinomonadaceae bacterium]
MENKANSVKLEQHSADVLGISLPNGELPKPKGIPSTDAELTRAFILKSHSTETRRTYKTTMQTFERFCQLRHGRKISFAEVTFNDVTAWRDWLIKEGKRSHTISTKLAILRSLFEYGRALGIFNLNPASAKLVPPPKKPKHSPGRALSPKEVMSLLSWFRLDDLLGARDYSLMLIMLRLSLRVSEVCNLKVLSIKSTNGRWVLTVKLKGGREERKPLPNDVKRAIDNYLKLDRNHRDVMRTNGQDAYLFQAEPNKRWFGENKPLSTRHVWHLVKKYSKLAGIGDVSPHDLRRTAITQAFKQKVPIRHIQRMSGHQDLNTLRLYDLDRENLEDNAINELSYEEKLNS